LTNYEPIKSTCYVLQSSLSNTGSEKLNQKEIENLGFSKPDVTKALRDEINKRAFVVGSLPIFNTLKEISIAAARNPQVQIPLSIPLYFGFSMPTFVALHIVEYTLPLGRTRNIVKGLKVISGLPFCTVAEIIDITSTTVLKTLDLPDASLYMQGTIGVPDDLKLTDVLEDMKRWQEENQGD
jgi:hypothetical protein